MRYLASTSHDGLPILVVEASDTEQAESRVKGALHALGLDPSCIFRCKELDSHEEVSVPEFRNEYFALMGFR